VGLICYGTSIGSTDIHLKRPSGQSSLITEDEPLVTVTGAPGRNFYYSKDWDYFVQVPNLIVKASGDRVRMTAEISKNVLDSKDVDISMRSEPTSIDAKRGMGPRHRRRAHGPSGL